MKNVCEQTDIDVNKIDREKCEENGTKSIKTGLDRHSDKEKEITKIIANLY